MSADVRERFRRQQTRDTVPELAVRKLLHASGLRYNVDKVVLQQPRRRADIVFPSIRVAVFIDGCFWHRCPTHGTSPANNSDWWREKLDRNVARDRETNQLLEDQGWTVLRFWEHEDPAAIAPKVLEAVHRRRTI